MFHGVPGVPRVKMERFSITKSLSGVVTMTGCQHVFAAYNPQMPTGFTRYIASVNHVFILVVAYKSDNQILDLGLHLKSVNHVNLLLCL